jgi:hypothetical protein
MQIRPWKVHLVGVPRPSMVVAIPLVRGILRDFQEQENTLKAVANAAPSC